MMGKGRKRKPGMKRTAKGRISRAATNFDRGTERAQAMQALYGQDGADAIGRAYRAGLLGDGQEAKALLDTARRISNTYWRAYGEHPITCTLGDKTSGGYAENCPEKAREREEWLSGSLTRVKSLGWLQRRYFDQLVIDVYPDHGPEWLDGLCFSARTKRAPIRPEDASAMELALEGLAMIAGVESPRVAKLKAA